MKTNFIHHSPVNPTNPRFPLSNFSHAHLPELRHRKVALRRFHVRRAVAALRKGELPDDGRICEITDDAGNVIVGPMTVSAMMRHMGIEEAVKKKLAEGA